MKRLPFIFALIVGFSIPVISYAINFGELPSNANFRGYYHLNGNALDASSNVRNGTTTGSPTALGNGVFGGYFFNGSNQRIDVANAVIPWATNTYTISFLFQLTTTTKTQYAFIGSQTTGAGTGGYYITYGLDTAGALSQNKVGVGSASVTYTWTQDLNWHNLIAVGDGTGMDLYLDGKFVAHGSNTSNLIQSNNLVGIGARQINPADFYAPARIDEVIFDGTRWTASRIRNYYSFVKGRYRPSSN